MTTARGILRRRGALLLAATLTGCSGFTTPRSSPASSLCISYRGVHIPPARARLPPRYMSGSESDGEQQDTPDDSETEREGYSWEELQADPELRQMEFDSSMNRRNNMLLPQRISAAVTALGWLFVVGGIILNSLGYAWVKNPSGGIGIGTLDERDFQKEVMRERREGLEEGKEATLSMSTGGIANEHISRWMEQQDQVSV